MRITAKKWIQVYYYQMREVVMLHTLNLDWRYVWYATTES